MDQYYHQWLYVKMILRNLSMNNVSINHEIRNILERFLLNKANNIPETKCFEEMHRELFDKKIDIDINRIKYFWDIMKKKQVIYDHEIILEPKFQYGACTSDVSPERIKILRKIGGDLETAKVIMRYESILSTTQHWNIPTIVYMKLVDEFQFNCECFASPINSQMLKISQTFKYINKQGEMEYSPAVIEKPTFCSIFKEDSPFGSLGSFFDANLEGLKCTAFTPYVPELYPLIVKKIKESLKSEKQTLFLTCTATWSDAEWYQDLEKMSTQTITLRPGEYWFEYLDEKQHTNFPTTFFLISNYKHPYINLKSFYSG